MNDLIKNSKSVDYVKNRVKARRFKKEDAKEVRNLIVRNFLEINSRDYGVVKQRAYFCVFLFFRNFMEKVLEAKL